MTSAAAPRDISGKPRSRIGDRKSTRLNSSHPSISYAVFCLKKKKTKKMNHTVITTQMTTSNVVTIMHLYIGQVLITMSASYTNASILEIRIVAPYLYLTLIP